MIKSGSLINLTILILEWSRSELSSDVIRNLLIRNFGRINGAFLAELFPGLKKGCEIMVSGNYVFIGARLNTGVNTVFSII